ncbi:Abhydrolase domain-containing protein C22H12.03 [Grifola frondosa]|uniref:Abhydrolase domain-containing protein C22H12.03 n=1 Tax=Grifola frondosa TaxID=5627 RepID=A0A1C7MBS0_GRIFR|nr:Abhydrolase domain-containing protein C22H12.03 [Grifola frondosa]
MIWERALFSPRASTISRTSFLKRTLTHAAPSATVHLHFDKHVPPDGNATDKPLVILHGLFGTKRNWGSLSKAFLRDLGRPVYALDLRNHGTSPHAEPMTYPAMAGDVLAFCHTHALTNVSLLGHSMGGKVAMTLALDPQLPEGLLRHLIVADIAPSKGDLSPEFEAYIRVMKLIEESNVTTRKQADELLAPHEQDPIIRAFLLTNLETAATHHKPLRFRVPVNIIGKSIPDLGGFPYELGARVWEGDTLFIKGTKSRYINNRNIPIAKRFFPNMVLETLDAGHWVHSERPNEFKALVSNFIKSH